MSKILLWILILGFGLMLLGWCLVCANSFFTNYFGIFSKVTILAE